jgi:hypothetical protein
MRAGTYALKPTLPYTPGSDGAGTVEAVGEGVKKVRRGDRVYTGRTLTGAYAEYALALEEQVHPLPMNIDFKQGASGYPMEPRIMRYITRRRLTLPKHRTGARCKWRCWHRGAANRARRGFEGSWYGGDAERPRIGQAGGRA